MDLKEQFVSRWNAHRWPLKDKPVLLAVSGGIDSMVLAHLLLEAGIPFAVAHCNFGLRGDESDGDEQLVAGWCAARGIPCFTMRFDTRAVAERTGRSIQETARELRYAWFEQLRSEQGLSLVATAHQADDNAETMIMNLCRGTGIAGLHGIPRENGHVIRPLLFAARKDIAAYAAAHQVPYREDSSNQKDDYLRNAIRHHVTPLLEQYMPGAVYRIGETSQRVGEAEEVYRRVLDKERRRLLQPRGRDVYVPVNLLVKTKPLYTITYELFRPYGFSAAQTGQLLQLLQAETGRYTESETYRVIRNRDFLVITERAAGSGDLILVEEVPATMVAGGHTYQFSLKETVPQLTTDDQIALIDASKVTFPLILRPWKDGDYFYPLGMGMKKKKISRFLTDLKVAAHLKKQVRVLECNRQIIWVAGMRLDERFKVRPSTTQVLRVAMK